MDADAVAVVTLPIGGTLHAHTASFHVECPMPRGLELWLFGGGPYPRPLGERLQFISGQTLGGFLRPVGVYSEEVQQRLEESAAFVGLAVEWVELPFRSMRRWFQFRVEAELVGKLFQRLHEFASETEEAS